MNARTERTYQPAYKRYGYPHIDGAGEREKYAAELGNEFCEADLDYVITASFSEEVYKRLGLKNPDRLKALMLDVMKAAGYYGPYCLVVHDKRGTTYWHPHLLVKNRDGIAHEIERRLFSIADLGKRHNGPILGSGIFAYQALRAVETWPNADHWEHNPRWRRRPRPHGRKKSQAAAA